MHSVAAVAGIATLVAAWVVTLNRGGGGDWCERGNGVGGGDRPRALFHTEGVDLKDMRVYGTEELARYDGTKVFVIVALLPS